MSFAVSKSIYFSLLYSTAVKPAISMFDSIKNYMIVIAKARIGKEQTNSSN